MLILFFSFPAYSQHMENHISPPSYMSQPMPPVHSGRYSPTLKTTAGEDDVSRYCLKIGYINLL